MIDDAFQKETLNSGKLSTIGNTLKHWKMYEEALAVFKKRLEYYPKKHSTHSQLGITYLLSEDYEKGVEQFRIALEKDATDSWASEYLRLLESINSAEDSH